MLKAELPVISIILPVYNGEDYLASAIDSVLQQTYQHFELIIVDDCSTDKCGEIAQSYANAYANIVYLRNEINLKLPASLNRGFKQAQGKYWTWTSCDNLYAANALEKMLAVIAADEKIGLVYASMQLINEQGENMGLLAAGPAEDVILRNVVGACFLYRASVAKKIGEYNCNMFLCEDYEYWLRIASHASIKPIIDVLYQYRRHAKSLSATREREIIAKGIAMQRIYYPIFIKTRRQAALFYAYLRDRDIYNPLRQAYLFKVLFYSPAIFFQEIYGLISRRFQ